MLRKLLLLPLLPFAFLAVGVVRLLRPLVTVRFGEILSGRIGHMAGNLECYLNERDAGMSQGWDVWYHRSEPCSEQLDRMLSRVIRIDRTPFTRVCAIVNQLFAGWERHHIGTAQVDRDIHNLLGKYPAHLSFTDRELEFAHNSLKRMGINGGSSAKWVCLIVRDAAYLPHLAYHSYRDSDVGTYEQAALALAERGYYVIRMGVKVEKAMGLIHPRVIDFATNGMHTDFMSMYLAAHCAFALSNGCGIDAIPVIFRRPICYVNYVPIEYLQTYHRGSLAIWKHHMKDGKRMTLAEIYASGAGHFMRAEQFEEAGITLVDNTTEEITAAAMEMMDAHDAVPMGKQAEFWRAFPRSLSTYNGRPLHGEIRMRIGAEFLRGYS